MLVFFMKKEKQTLINIGTGKDFTIREYAFLINIIINPKKNLKLNLIKLSQMEHQEKS